MRVRLRILCAGLAIALGSAALVARFSPPTDLASLELTEPIAKVRTQFPEVAHIDTAAVVRRIEASKGTEIQLVDVREPEEFAVSHIPGAINVPSGTPQEVLLSRIRSDIPVVVYCSVGYRSAQIARRLKTAGRQNVVNYVGSFFDWANRGEPMQSSAGPASTVHPYDSSWGRFLHRERRAGQ
jgi:rhodanese-related sulfurtransferase